MAKSKIKNEEIKKFCKLESLSKKLADNLEETTKLIEGIKAKSKNLSEKCFNEGVKIIFSKYPNLKSFSWNQYTPNWNDGDECLFGAHTDSLTINGEKDNEEYVYNLKDLLKKLKSPHLKKEKEKLQVKLDKMKDKTNTWEYSSTQNEIKELDRNVEEVANKINLLEDIGSILNNIDGETYKDMFGDHVTVIVTEDEILTESYEHD